MYPRPVTHIRQIEITSRCNLRCVYCTSPNLGRPKVDMTEEIFQKVLDLAARWMKGGTQDRISLCGIGEPTIHPQFIQFLRLAREKLPEGILDVTTNGVKFTDEMARTLADCNIFLGISMHRPEIAGRAAFLAEQYGVAF